MRLSFVIPVFNEAPALEALVDGILTHAGTGDIEILLVDDGSTDDSPRVITELAERHPQVVPLSLGTHQGKTQALKAGLERVRGEFVFTMDSDLQDDPSEIPAFLEKLSEGSDLVSGWKRVRHDPRARIRASTLYNAVVRWLFNIDLHDVNCGFKAMRREVADSLVSQLNRDYHRLIPVLAVHNGYRVSEIPVTHHARRYGRSKYGPSRYVRALLDVLILRLRSGSRSSFG